MNLLESLALRMLDGSPAIAPPRIPYQQLLPPDPQPTAPLDDEAGWSSPQATPRRGVAPDRVMTPQAVRAQATEPARAVDARLGGDDDERAGPATAPPADPPAQHTMLLRAGADPGPRAAMPAAREDPAASPPTQATSPSPGLRVLLREVHHVEHHHHALTMPAPVEPAPQPPPTPPDAPVTATPRADDPRPPARAAPAPQPMRAPAPSMLQPRPPAPAERVRPSQAAAVPPVVHVEIGRITVRLQGPPASKSTETTRPAAPSLGLEAYSASRRARGR